MRLWIPALGGLLVAFAVSSVSPLQAAKEMAQPGEQAAHVQLKNPDNKVVGEATLLQDNDGVLIQATFTGLPAGTHAFHIHEKGSCEAPDFKSAGGHFNPKGAKHGLRNPQGPHAGDMPNFVVGKSGKTTLEVYNNRVTLEKGASNSLFQTGGTALVVHEGKDDYTSDPAGDAGKRIACGVIEAGRP